MASSKVAGPLLVHWDILSPTGPQVAYHTSCVIGSFLYVHGGISSKKEKSPLAQLHRMDLGARLWQKVRAPECPALSHHACVAIDDRYMMLIGGWDGKVRTTQVCVFDTQEEKWSFPTSSGFPVGGGLSSHTATPLSEKSILVIGREGGIRIQRRSGNAFLLTGTIAEGSFTWTEHALAVDSRSGHTTHILGNTLYSVGGRADKLYEMHSGYKSSKASCGFTKQLAAFLPALTPMAKLPVGRKHHVATEGAGVIFLHGGETFDGKSRDPVSDAFILTVKPTVQCFRLGSAPIGRAGHSLACSGDLIIVHGGEGAKNNIHGDTYQITVSQAKYGKQ